ncbi:single-stranded DNA-binding protein [Bifidobacterium vespertilionis]|uniref:single-stranded DNA-binding protein n=1 Tax=Bifidobacterium vespertilionis TaxID=2562524 RepID=UPI001BDD6E81|nr:single-stranded DNA-binding protein [Bifidobacterium vespertilionis]MBT1180332.1 single-stranded DNA-binding protein [Bifidobacterium vespertilionis]
MAVPTFTIVGNLAADPEVRQGNNGPWATFTVITTTRRRNRDTNEWEDGDRASFRCVVYGDLAANLGSSLSKGLRVIASGRLRDRQYTDNQGQTRYTTEFIVDEIGPSLRYATAQVARTSGGSGSYSGGFQGGNRGGFQGNSGFQGNRGGYNGGAGYSGGSSYSGGASASQSAPAAAPQTGADPWGSPAGGSFGSFGSSDDFGGANDEPEF